jgi:hypothetical protein
MGKRGLIWLSLILFVGLSGSTQGYTVVFKGGKTLEGMLISETADTVVFKDASGLQLSLKKKNLDLERMGELNAAKAAPSAGGGSPKSAVAASPQKPVSSKKGTKVFTNADLPSSPAPENQGSSGGTVPEVEKNSANPSASPTETAVNPAAPENLAPASATPPAAANPTTTIKKEGKVFTNEKVAPSEPQPEAVPVEPAQSQPMPQTAPGTTSSSDTYYKDLREGAVRLAKTLQDLSALSDEIAVNWEVAASTGNDSKRSVRDYMSGATATAILGNVSRQVDSLQSLQGKLSPAPAGYEQSYLIFTKAVDSVKNFQSQIQQFDSIQNMNLLKSRLTELTSKINSSVGVLQSLQPVKPNQ